MFRKTPILLESEFSTASAMSCLSRSPSNLNSQGLNYPSSTAGLRRASRRRRCLKPRKWAFVSRTVGSRQR